MFCWCGFVLRMFFFDFLRFSRGFVTFCATVLTQKAPSFVCVYRVRFRGYQQENMNQNTKKVKVSQLGEEILSRRLVSHFF